MFYKVSLVLPSKISPSPTQRVAPNLSHKPKKLARDKHTSLFNSKFGDEEESFYFYFANRIPSTNVTSATSLSPGDNSIKHYFVVKTNIS